MKQDIYSIFYSKTKNKFISRILTHLAFFVLMVIYNLKKLKAGNKIVKSENADEIINKVFPKTDYEIDLDRVACDESVDISVIIPVYNYKDVIPSCIDSVINQKTNYKFEVILVDDGSTDGAGEICDKYAAGHKNVISIHQQNARIGAARNTGLKNARGKYIMFVDCDDYVHDNFIQTMLNKAYETGNDIIISSYSLVKKSEGKEISRRDVVCSQKNLKGYKDSKDLIMNYQGLPWNKIYKREIFDNIRYIKGYWYEDIIVHFLIFRICKSYCYIDESLYDYMWYENNFSHTQNAVSPQSVQRYWLLEVMAEETKRIGLGLDTQFYKILLRHSGREVYDGIHSFDNEVKEAVFTKTCDIIKKYKPQESYSLTYLEKQLEKALINRNITKWETVSKYI